ncbi:TrlF family AAA-like ATPase [Pigmentiphaga sp. YJ18]|uniref:TrlF family AAA-like ATPase n=1 Tax=Pigmentiphaga sp. YJ18 TaxID=3134907 RepID=UPI003115EC5C
MAKPMEMADPRGSLWRRWDPHIHTPGTALNDQYIGEAAWETFLGAIESADPPIQALGITDYFSIERYLQVCEHQRQGRLSNVGLIFPNIELRLSIETSKASAINLHLLFDPAPHDHVEQIKRFLLELEFTYLGYNYRCQSTDLIRLGRAHRSGLTDDEAALSEGANLFKVNFDQLRAAWGKNAWVQNHALVAVAGGERDGTSGLRDEFGSFSALRKEIEGFADIIFSASPKQIEFWLGKGAASVQKLESEWNGCKPCLHGSDAHDVSRIGRPDQERRCWIKGDLTFETLRQVCLEPEGRVFIGAEPPRGALPGQTIKSLTISNAPWLSRDSVELNPGLVAVIGAKGSGKTALADLIAAGGIALANHLNAKSFIRRAQEHLGDCEASLHWESGEKTGNHLTQTDMEELLDHPHVQYLSQQFVDQLCSAEGLDDTLIQEVERVIFNAHPVTERFGAESFRELLEIRLETSRQKRERQEQTLRRASTALAVERTQKANLKALEKDRDEKKKSIENDKKDRQSLVPKGNEERASRHEVVSQAVEEKRKQVEHFKLRHQALLHLQEDVIDFRQRIAPSLLTDWQENRFDAHLSPSDWKAFEVDFVGEVDALLRERVKQAQAATGLLLGPAKTDPPMDPDADAKVALIATDAVLSQQTLSLLEREQTRLRTLVGVDAQNAKRFSALSDKITKAETTLGKVAQQIQHIQGADERIRVLIDARRKAYAGIFEAIVEEEQELQALYAPVKERIDAAEGSLSKLSFSVRRQVDITAWASAGEALLDLRTSGPFRGRGELLRVVRAALLDVWTTGSAEQAANALLDFVKSNEENLKTHQPEGQEFREWAHSVSNWLFSTGHITVGYGIQYDGVDIEQLSPGTRGIVLLLLYLAIDAEDLRPLIIDQPEENLDPQSIFQELVQRFRAAKYRRQIIIVTHNANLVVNTDADQVIVASCGPHRPGQLPLISYEFGSLENPQIRQHVCDILEGGERAFKERAKRLRLGLRA